MNSFSRLGSCVALWMLLASVSSAQTVIKLGTIAPEGSVWHDALLEIREKWREISDGEIELRVYAGGVLGGEDEMIRKMQRRNLDALAVSGAGLPLIDSVVECLQLPLFFDSYAELAALRARIGPELERSFEQRGYKILSWAEAGWVHFFAKTPVRTPEDLRELRLWVGSGAPESERLTQELGFRAVPLPVTDMLMGLQTGLIEVIDVPPLFALLDRSFQAAPYMTELPFAPLVAATVITLPAWERVPETYRMPFLAAARAAAEGIREEIQVAEREAIDEMAARGLDIVTLEAAEAAVWHREARDVYGRLACGQQHPALFEEVMRFRREVLGRD
jgi:TRAP-type C4-dicarboxylate transport system substrate-binding protein